MRTGSISVCVVRLTVDGDGAAAMERPMTYRMTQDKLFCPFLHSFSQKLLKASESLSEASKSLSDASEYLSGVTESPVWYFRCNLRPQGAYLQPLKA